MTMRRLLLIFAAFLAVVNVAAAFSAASNKKQPSKLAQKNFQKWRPYLSHSTNFDVSNAGGWNFVENLAENPKQELVDYIMSFNSDDIQVQNDDHKLQALVGLLEAQGKGYDSSLVEGEWVSVVSQQGTKSPKIQKLVGTREKRKNAYANFDTDAKKFHGKVKILKWGDLRSTVKFDPVPDNFDTINDKIVLRRISCDIVGASWKFWKLPRIPLPLRAKGGYLDFMYLDDDIRITRGNQGGLFVHFRPEFLEQQSELQERKNENIAGEGI